LKDDDIKRFLKARQFRVENAKEMIEKWAVFRKTPVVLGSETTPDNILSSSDHREDARKYKKTHSLLRE